MIKKVFGQLAELNSAFHVECMKREQEVPGSYAVVTDRYVSKPVSNAAFRAAVKYRKDQEEIAVAAGISSDVYKAASAGKHGLALSQVLPCLAEIETNGLINLLVNGECDARGVSREHAIREVFKKFFPVSKESAPRVRFQMLNKQANCRVFACAFLTNSTAPLTEVDRLFRPPEKGKSSKEGQGEFKNSPVLKKEGANGSK